MEEDFRERNSKRISQHSEVQLEAVSKISYLIIVLPRFLHLLHIGIRTLIQTKKSRKATAFFFWGGGGVGGREKRKEDDTILMRYTGGRHL